MIKDSIIDYKKDMKITEPCIIRGMPNEVYHSTIGLSTSGLKMLLDCPAKYYYKYLSGEYEPKEKPCFKIGKACHTYILEGAESFEATYWHNPYKKLLKEDILNVLRDRCRLLFSPDLKFMPLSGRSRLFNYKRLMRYMSKMFDKYGKNKSIKDYNVSDLTPILFILDGTDTRGIELDSNELNQVIGVGRAINNNKFAKNAFSQKGESELSLFWIDEATGLWLKCRPDFLPYDCKLVPDYKTCTSANPQTFYGDFIKFGYHFQAANYREGIYQVTKFLFGKGIEVESFFFIVQEKEAPYITQPYLPDMNIVDYGQKGIRKAINIHQECIEKGFWDNYSDHIIEMSLSPKPDDLIGNFDVENAIAYAPRWVDSELLKY